MYFAKDVRNLPFQSHDIAMRISKRSKSLTSLNWAWGIGGAGGASAPALPSFDSRNRSKTVSFQRHVQIIPFGRKFGSLTIRKSGKVHSFLKQCFYKLCLTQKRGLVLSPTPNLSADLSCG